MSNEQVTKITIEQKINASVEKVWACWTEPKHIMGWTFASDDWHCPRAENDISVGGKFSTRMEAKDGSTGFDFYGVYGEVELHKTIVYTIADVRKVWIGFKSEGDNTIVTETFEAENENPVEMQKAGWQAILDNFKKYVESN